MTQSGKRGFVGSQIQFVVADNPYESNKKMGLIQFNSGDIQVMVPFDPQQAQGLAAFFMQGILQTAEACRQANGGLILPTNIELPKMNGRSSE